jgi:hypothetical protein
MRNTYLGSSRRITVIIAILSLIIAPSYWHLAIAAETDAGPGVGVSGTTGKPAATGKGALPPPPEEMKPTDAAKPKEETPPVQSAQPKEVPKGIGASAGTAGTAAAESGGGVSLGMIGAGVLAIGLLVGVASAGAGGDGGNSSGGH